MMTYESWTPVSSGMILFGLGGLHLYFFLLFVFPNLFQRLFFTLIAIGSLVIIFIVTVFSTYTVEVYRQEGYIIYVKEYRFIFSGHDDYYLKENFLFAKKIGTGEQSEESYSTYTIEDGIFYITTQYESGTTQIFSIELDH